MQSELFADLPQAQRKQYLSDNCQKVEHMGYMKRFTPEEMEQNRIKLADVSIDIDALEDEKKEAVAAINDTLKKRKTSRAKLLKDIKNKAEFVEEQCYVFYDEEDRQVGHYNERGQLINQRPMRPEEMQRNLFAVSRNEDSRTGTND